MNLEGQETGEGELASSPDDYRVWGSVVSSLSGVGDRSPAADEFSKFWSFQNASTRLESSYWRYSRSGKKVTDTE